MKNVDEDGKNAEMKNGGNLLSQKIWKLILIHSCEKKINPKFFAKTF